MKDNVIFRYKDGRIIPIKVDNLKSPSEYMNAKIRELKKVKKITKKDITADLLTEKIYKIEDFKDLERDELIKIRDEVTEKINWLMTSEYYDSKKFKILSANEKKLNKLIFK